MDQVGIRPPNSGLVAVALLMVVVGWALLGAGVAPASAAEPPSRAVCELRTVVAEVNQERGQDRQSSGSGECSLTLFVDQEGSLFRSATGFDEAAEKRATPKNRGQVCAARAVPTVQRDGRIDAEVTTLGECDGVVVRVDVGLRAAPSTARQSALASSGSHQLNAAI